MNRPFNRSFALLAAFTSLVLLFLLVVSKNKDYVKEERPEVVSSPPSDPSGDVLETSTSAISQDAPSIPSPASSSQYQLTPAQQRIQDDPANGKYFQYLPGWPKAVAVGDGVSQGVAREMHNYMHLIFRTHPSRQIHDVFYRALGEGDLTLIFGESLLPPGAMMAFGVIDIPERGLTPALLVEPSAIYQTAQETRRHQLTLFHESCHYVQYLRDPQSEVFTPKTGPVPVDQVRPWIQNEIEAHWLMAQEAYRLGWIMDHPMGMAYESGLNQALMNYSSSHPNDQGLRHCLQQQPAGDPISRMRSFVKGVLHQEINFPGAADLRQDLEERARESVITRVEEVYLQFPYLSEEGKQILRQTCQQSLH